MSPHESRRIPASNVGGPRDVLRVQDLDQRLLVLDGSGRATIAVDRLALEVARILKLPSSFVVPEIETFEGPGTTGLVPDPETTTGRFLQDDGHWMAPGGSGLGDMTKAVYDTDNDGRVDNAENVNDGTNLKTAAQVAGHIDSVANPHATSAAQVGAPPTSRLINTTAPIAGGGDLSADRTLSLNDDGVTYAKIQNVSAASRLLGRGSAGGAGDPEELVLGTNLSMSGTTLNASGGGTTPTGTGFRHVTSGVEDAAAKLVDTADVNDDQITNAKLANMAQNRVKGRVTASTGDPEDLTQADMDTVMAVSTSPAADTIPRTQSTLLGSRLVVTWLKPSSSAGFLVTDVSLAVNYLNAVAGVSALAACKVDGSLAMIQGNVGRQVAVIKGAGTDWVGARYAHTAFPGTPVEGQWCWRDDYQDEFWFNATLSEWLGALVAFPFWVSADQAATAYLVYGHSSGTAFADAFGFQVPWRARVVGISLLMQASGTASVQVFGGGSAVGGTGDTLALSAVQKKSAWGVYSNSIAKDTVLGVKCISGTVEGPATGIVYLRRAESS